MWHKVLSDSVIHDLAVRSLLNLYLLPALNLAAEINPSDALDKCRNVSRVHSVLIVLQIICFDQ